MKRKIPPGECSFEEWDSKLKIMTNCHSQATHKMAGHKLCEFHARYAQGIRASTSASVAQRLEEIKP